jgi:hypothetical protein
VPSKSDQSPKHSAIAGGQDWRWRLFEVVWIFLVLYLFVGSPPPDAGESHYLVKAKHYWNKDFCRGDLFLESADAHLVFCWVFGWVTKFCSLEATAWIGRAVTWAGFAFAWQRLSWGLAPRRFWSILSAGLMLALLRGCNMSRELIVVGGVEAKVFAYVLVLLAMGELVRGRWNIAWILVGGASAMHVIVGGWSGVAFAITWLAGPKDRPPLVRMLPGLGAALGLALLGLVPALQLTWGQDQATVLEAHQIYVFERLPHHLVFHRFGNWMIARHLALVTAWAWLAWLSCHTLQPNMPGIVASLRLNRIVLGAVSIALVGVVLDQSLVAWATLTGASQREYQALAAPLLRYYFFRLSDALTPMAVALSVMALLRACEATRPALSSWGLIAVLLVGALNLGEVCVDRALRPLPGAWLQPHPTPDCGYRAWQFRGKEGTASLQKARQQFEDWRDVCLWIQENTHGDDRFLTPRQQQTFKWYAKRAEVVSWKDIPQDAAGLVAWRRTLSEVFPPEGMGSDLGAHSDEKLAALARKYGAAYVVLDRTRTSRPIGLPRVYPDWDDRTSPYVVYRIPALVEKTKGAKKP